MLEAENSPQNLKHNGGFKWIKAKKELISEWKERHPEMGVVSVEA
ncbi:MAG: hypothetical protein ACLSFO_02095 [Anaerovoracaceae bacterium]